MILKMTMKTGDTVKMREEVRKFLELEDEDTSGVVQYSLQNGGVLVEPAIAGIRYWNTRDLEIVGEGNV